MFDVLDTLFVHNAFVICINGALGRDQIIGRGLEPQKNLVAFSSAFVSSLTTCSLGHGRSYDNPIKFIMSAP
jgi:hypothetical protein